MIKSDVSRHDERKNGGLRLRHLHIANPKTGPARGLFLYVPMGFAGTIRPSETGQPREIDLQTPTVSFHPPFALGETDS